MTARPFLLALAVLAAARPAVAQSQDPSDQPRSTSAADAPPPPPAAAARPAPAGNPLQRIPRITVELVLGGASAAGMAYGGYQLGCALSGDSSSSFNCGTGGAYGAVAGFALGIPIGVMLGGSLLDGDGAVLPTVFGTGLGMAAVVGGMVFLRSNAPEADLTPLVVIPLVFAVAGYELSSPDSRAASQARARGKQLSLRIAPTAAITRNGAALGVMMVLP